MAKLVVGMFMTVDGVMQAPGGPEEDTSGGFTHGGWSAGYWDEQMGEIIDASLKSSDAFLFGRKTYDIFAGYWPSIGEDHPDASVAAILNRAPKFVASTTLERVDWENSTLLTGDVAKAVAKLKDDTSGVIQTQGSGDLIQTLLGADLVDEFRLWVFPLLLGSGKRLFADGTVPAGLELVDCQTSSTGVALQTYVREGDIKYGDFTNQ